MKKKLLRTMAKYNKSFYFESEKEAIEMLKIEAKRLKRVAVKVWHQYLASYRPKEYVRTGKSEKAIKIGDVKRKGNDFIIEVYFDNDLVYHDSVISPNEPKGHSVMLISSGWKAVNLERKIGRRDHFTRYKGFNYLGKVAQEYRKVGHKGIFLDIQWKNDDYKNAGRPFTKK